jgi:hypothetical protein
MDFQLYIIITIIIIIIRNELDLERSLLQIPFKLWGGGGSAVG